MEYVKRSAIWIENNGVIHYTIRSEFASISWLLCYIVTYLPVKFYFGPFWSALDEHNAKFKKLTSDKNFFPILEVHKIWEQMKRTKYYLQWLNISFLYCLHVLSIICIQYCCHPFLLTVHKNRLVSVVNGSNWDLALPLVENEDGNGIPICRSSRCSYLFQTNRILISYCWGESKYL